MQTMRELEIPKLWLPILSCPVSTHHNSLLGSAFTYCTLLSCRITAAFAAFLSFCPKWSRNPSESKWINQKTTIQSGLYKDEEYYELMLLLLNMHEFLISRAKNRDVYHRISPGCTIFIQLHPAKKQATGKRTLAVHFHCALNSALNKKKKIKKSQASGALALKILKISILCHEVWQNLRQTARTAQTFMICSPTLHQEHISQQPSSHPQSVWEAWKKTPASGNKYQQT